MPAMKRTSKKAQRIAEMILGTPPNLQSNRRRKRKKRDEQLLAQDVRLMR